MISLNDVLLAASNIPVDDPIAEIWGRGLQGGYKIIEYTGSLPITINANGDALLDYRIYGADGGVGVATENLWNPNTAEKKYIVFNGTISDDPDYALNTIPIEAGSTYYFYASEVYSGVQTFWQYRNNNDEIIGGVRNARAVQRAPFIAPEGATKVIICFQNAWDNDEIRDFGLYKRSTAPTSYIPYGYKLPMTVQSANLFDKNAQDVDKGFISKTRLNNDGTTRNQYGFNVSEYIAVQSETSYYFGKISTDSNFGPSECFYDSEKNFISSYTPRFKNSFVATTPTNAAYVRVSYNINNAEQIIIEGTEPPSTYIPYSRTDTPIYIGENQLDAIGEFRDYVDFGIQKIARKIREYTFTGNETFNLFAQNAYGTCWVNLRLYTTIAYCPRYQTTLRSSHFTAINNSDANFWYGYPQLDDACNFEVEDGYDTVKIFFRSTANFSTAEECKAYFKEQYDNGTPVKIWFVMKYTVGQYESTDNGKEDPPVPLPEIPTIEGETVIAYDGDPKPSQMYVKYKGKSGGA